MLCLSAYILCPLSHPVSGCPLVRERSTATGRWLALNAVIIILSPSSPTRQKCVPHYFVIRLNANKLQRRPTQLRSRCNARTRMCVVVIVNATMVRQHSWEGEDGNPEQQVFSPHPSPLLDSYLLSPLLPLFSSAEKREAN